MNELEMRQDVIFAGEYEQAAAGPEMPQIQWNLASDSSDDEAVGPFFPGE